MEYNETVKKLERALVRHESGDVSLGEFTLPKGLQHRQYIGIAAMFVAMDWGLQVKADVPCSMVGAEDVKGMVELANQLMNARGV